MLTEGNFSNMKLFYTELCYNAKNNVEYSAIFKELPETF